MLAVVELFKDDGTVDELGIGSIRDVLADTLFPGTSVLHSRARYLLLIPWLVQSAMKAPSAEAAVDRLRASEYQLIHALIAGQGPQGVIGARAKDQLKRLPSAAYWAALRRYQITRVEASIEGFFRLYVATREVQGREPVPDDLDARAGMGEGLLDPDLPVAPLRLTTEASFVLSPGEQEYLRHRIQLATPGSLLAWLLGHGRPSMASQVWDHELSEAFPAALGEVVDVGRRFATAIHGAAVLYNLLLAQRLDNEEEVARYEDMLTDWGAELARSEPFSNGWLAGSLWKVMDRQRKPVHPYTQSFVELWFAAVAATGEAAARDPRMGEMVRQREIALKGGRARLANASALEAWKGNSGLVRLDYRWTVTRTMINDILATDGVGG